MGKIKYVYKNIVLTEYSIGENFFGMYSIDEINAIFGMRAKLKDIRLVKSS